MAEIRKNEALLEVVDENDFVVRLEKRGIIHQKGLLHREVHIYFLTPHEEIIFQHRAKNKEARPDKLDATVGGHVEPGMSYAETAIKECREETGLNLHINDLVFVKKTRSESFDETTGMTNNVFRTYYAYLYKGDINDLKVEEGKSLGFESWSIDKLFRLSDKEKERFIPIIISEENLKMIQQIKNQLL
ncbi:MAG: NUDIX domain-containing protein [Candidatus Pacebacteria bacterium]|nr:NUDIX domain-containing protein [Candidatus Paceibacterota bacterium]